MVGCIFPGIGPVRYPYPGRIGRRKRILNNTLRSNIGKLGLGTNRTGDYLVKVIIRFQRSIPDII